MRMALGSSKNTEIGSLLSRKADLIRNIFILLLAQLVVMGMVAHFTISKKASAKSSTSSKLDLKSALITVFSIIAIIAIIIMMVFIIMDPTKNPILRITCFTIFSVLVGISLSYVKKLPAKTVMMATVTTVVAFFAMGAIGYITAHRMLDLSPMETWLFGAFVIMILTSLTLALYYPKEPKVRKVMAVIWSVLFSLYIMYDTNQILMGDVDFISGAFEYFLDIVNLFQNLLQVFSEN